MQNIAPGRIKLTQIESSINYFDEHGYVYSRNNSKKLKNLYFRCKNSVLLNCPARAILKNRNPGDSEGYLTKKHSHLPNDCLLQKSKFDKILDDVYQSNKFKSSQDIYLEARKKITTADQLNTPGSTSYSSFLHRRRRKNIPKIPRTIDEFENLINDDQFKQQYSFDQRNLAFYRGIWKDKNGHSMVVFLSETGLQKLKEMSDDGDIEILMDGTFKILPRHLKFCQLYIMSFIFEERSYPFAFIFMEKRDFVAYDALFENLKTFLLPDTFMKVTKCMSDYEAAVRKALRKHFTNARISGCFFHFVKAINKTARRFGLIKKTTKSGLLHQAVQEVCALALLPNNFISEGFRAIDTKYRRFKRWNRFAKYWSRQWKRANVSVYGLINRCNNFSEALNRVLNKLNGKAHQDIWVVLGNLKDLEMLKADELVKHVKGKMFDKRRTGRMIELNKKIDNATETFEKTLDVKRFLRNMTYQSIFDTLFRNEILFEGENESDIEDENNDDSVEYFTYNDINAVCNFQPPLKPLTLKRKGSYTEWYVCKKPKFVALF